MSGKERDRDRNRFARETCEGACLFLAQASNRGTNPLKEEDVRDGDHRNEEVCDIRGLVRKSPGH